VLPDGCLLKNPANGGIVDEGCSLWWVVMQTIKTYSNGRPFIVGSNGTRPAFSRGKP
jgi:hypothetical protein